MIPDAGANDALELPRAARWARTCTSTGYALLRDGLARRPRCARSRCARERGMTVSRRPVLGGAAGGGPAFLD